MSLVFSRAAEADRAEFDQIQSWVYRGEAKDEPSSDPMEGGIWACVRQDGKMVSVCTAWEMNAQINHRSFRCGGIAGVATLAEARRSGAASCLMNGILREMKNDGMEATSLYAYRETYYARFGYASCGWRWQITVPGPRMPKVESSLPVRRLEPDQVMLLDPCYRSFISELSGCHVRSEEDWKERLGQKAPAIYAVGDPVEGYAWTKISGFWGEVTFGEVAWSTQEGYQGILGVMTGLVANQTSAIWCEPPHSPFLDLYADQGVKSERHRPTMFRILDVPGVLGKFFAGTEAKFCLQVQDHQLEDNSGAWTVNGGEVTPGGQPDFTISVASLSQAILGSPSIKDLRRWQMVSVHNSEVWPDIERLFGERQAICMEFF